MVHRREEEVKTISVGRLNFGLGSSVALGEDSYSLALAPYISRQEYATRVLAINEIARKQRPLLLISLALPLLFFLLSIVVAGMMMAGTLNVGSSSISSSSGDTKWDRIQNEHSNMFSRFLFGGLTLMISFIVIGGVAVYAYRKAHQNFEKEIRSLLLKFNADSDILHWRLAQFEEFSGFTVNQSSSGHVHSVRPKFTRCYAIDIDILCNSTQPLIVQQPAQFNYQQSPQFNYQQQPQPAQFNYQQQQQSPQFNYQQQQPPQPAQFNYQQQQPQPAQFNYQQQPAYNNVQKQY